MRVRAVGTALSLALLAGGAVAADIKSGPQKGGNVGAFYPLNVCNAENPSQNGKKACLV